MNLQTIYPIYRKIAGEGVGGSSKNFSWGGSR